MGNSSKTIRLLDNAIGNTATRTLAVGGSRIGSATSLMVEGRAKANGHFTLLGSNGSRLPIDVEI